MNCSKGSLAVERMSSDLVKWWQGLRVDDGSKSRLALTRLRGGLRCLHGPGLGTWQAVCLFTKRPEEEAELHLPLGSQGKPLRKLTLDSLEISSAVQRQMGCVCLRSTD